MKLFLRILTWPWRWLTGKTALFDPKQIDIKELTATTLRERFTRMRETLAARRHDTPSLMTGVIVALTTGVIRKRPTSRPGPHLRSGFSARRGTPHRLIGKPRVYERNGIAWSETEWLEPGNWKNRAGSRLARLRKLLAAA